MLPTYLRNTLQMNTYYDANYESQFRKTIDKIRNRESYKIVLNVSEKFSIVDTKF